MTGDLLRAFNACVAEDERLTARMVSRRDFLRQSVLTTGALALAPVLGASASGASASGTAASGAPPSVAIVGAGIAGLNACYQLKKQGVLATVYEASSRAGGRMFTMRDVFGEGLTTDIGGEFVDSTHADIRQLVAELGLSLYELHRDPLAPKTYYFGGRHRDQEELKTALSPYVSQLMKDIHSLPPVLAHWTAGSFRRLDEQSITDYLRRIGIGGWLYDYLSVTLTREYGMEAAQQSAVNFLIMFEPPVPDEKNYELFGQDHEIYKIRGGSQQLTDALYAKVHDQVRLGHKLAGLSGGADRAHRRATAGSSASTMDAAYGAYKLILEHDGKQTTVEADHILLTLPFTQLRRIPFPGLPDGKRRCIDGIGYGNSCKFILGMDQRPWRKAGKTGYTFTDISFGCGWDSSQMQGGQRHDEGQRPGNGLPQPEDRGSFTVFGGGDFGAEMAANDKAALLDKYLPGLEEIYPGAKTAFNGRTVKFCWAQNPYSVAGYSSFKTGQWSTLAGWEAAPVGNIEFAGEHVSREFQGYMNGGANTGRMAAQRILKKIKHV